VRGLVVTLAHENASSRRRPRRRGFLRRRRAGLAAVLELRIESIGNSPVIWIVNSNPLASEQWVPSWEKEGWSAAYFDNRFGYFESRSGRRGWRLIDDACLRPADSRVLGEIKSKAEGLPLILTSDSDPGNERIIALLEREQTFLSPRHAGTALLAKLKSHLGGSRAGERE